MFTDALANEWIPIYQYSTLISVPFNATSTLLLLIGTCHGNFVVRTANGVERTAVEWNILTNQRGGTYFQV